jgi:ferredoxin--NADP+ reductase
MFDRMPTPWGLVRAGVAPDHQTTKQITKSFEWLVGAPACRLHLGVEVGKDVSCAELGALHHAVIYAQGAAGSQHLGIPGEHLPGSVAATDFVGWYNGHPDARDLHVNLSEERVVVVGNGNVALDVARVLLMPVDLLRQTDIADHALEALAESRVHEVVLLGRRGPAQSAFTTPELLGMREVPAIDIVVESDESLDPHSESGVRPEPNLSYDTRLKLRAMREIVASGARGMSRRVVLRFLRAPIEVVGGDRTRGLVVARTQLVLEADRRVTARVMEETHTIETGMVIRSVGYRAAPMAGLPFDERRAVISNRRGRVVDDQDAAIPGAYVTGWIKRGPTGVIGTNKHCARESVEALLEDHGRGRLPHPTGGARELDKLLDERAPGRLTRTDWCRLDAHEVSTGRAQGRPRVKVVDVAQMKAVAARTQVPPTTLLSRKAAISSGP